MTQEVKPPRAGRGDFERSLVEGVDLAQDTALEVLAASTAHRFRLGIKALTDDIYALAQREIKTKGKKESPLALKLREDMPYWFVDAIQGTLGPGRVMMVTTDPEPTPLRAETLYVGEEMCELVECVADEFQLEAIHESDLLVPCGLAFFDGPQQFTVHRTLGEGGNLLPLDDDHEPDETAVVNYTALWWAATGGFSVEAEIDERGLALVALNHWKGEWLPVFAGTGRFDAIPGDVTQAFGEVRRTFQVLMRLCAQKLVPDLTMDPSRAVRRRAKKAGIPPENARVRVVTLRKESKPLPDDHLPEPGNWSHRWIVKPHWRNQWYPSLGTHRQILVGPYVKGPETLPLKLPEDRGFALVR